VVLLCSRWAVLCCGAACVIIRKLLAGYRKGSGFEEIASQLSDVEAHEGQGLGSAVTTVVENNEDLARLRNMWGSMFGLSLHFSEAAEDQKLFEQDIDDNPIIRALKNTRIHDTDQDTGQSVPPLPNTQQHSDRAHASEHCTDRRAARPPFVLSAQSSHWLCTFSPNTRMISLRFGCMSLACPIR
jgi:hypothetical protein